MRPHGICENVLNWEDRHISYNLLSSVLNEAVAGFAHLYAYGDFKCTFISQLLGRPVFNLEDLNSPSPRYFSPKSSCTKPCHGKPLFRCVTRHAHSLYKLLMYHLQKISLLPALLRRPIILPDLLQLYKAARICHLHSFHDGITTACYTQRILHLRRYSLRSQHGTATVRLLP